MIDNASDDPETLRYLAALPHRVLRIANPDGRFNFAAINNAAAAMVEEELLLFLNDDTEVINPRWLSQMVGWSRLEGVGAVGRGSCTRMAGSSTRASSTASTRDSPDTPSGCSRGGSGGPSTSRVSRATARR